MRKLFLILATLAFCLPVSAEQVHDVYDGDTFHLTTPQTHCFMKGKKPQKYQGIRILWADAPEKKQSFGLDARSYLEKLVMGRDVQLECHGCNFARRTCHVAVNGLDVGKDLVGWGLAFDSPKFSKGAYAGAEAFARKLGRGVWTLPDGGARPWDWRKH